MNVLDTFPTAFARGSRSSAGTHKRLPHSRPPDYTGHLNFFWRIAAQEFATITGAGSSPATSAQGPHAPAWRRRALAAHYTPAEIAGRRRAGRPARWQTGFV